MPIFSLNDINKVIAFEDDLKTHFDKILHIQKCYDQVLNDAVISYFGDSYLFHRAYYLDDKNKFHSIDFKLDAKAETKKIVKIINNGVHEIESGKHPITFTELMCKSKKQVLCLYNKKLWQISKNVLTNDLMFCQNIKSKAINCNIAEFFGRDQIDINRLIDHYREIVNCTKYSGCYIYFIRPFTNFENYNGVFSIILKRKLKDSEIIDLGTMWTKILSDTSIIEVVKSTKRDEQDYIFEEHTHTWNSEITSLYRHIDVIDKRFYTDTNLIDVSTIRRHIDFAVSKTNTLREIVKLNLFLMKTHGFRDWSEDEINNFSNQHKILIENNKIQKVDLKLILKDAINTVESIVESYKGVDGLYSKKMELIKGLNKDLEKIAETSFNAIPTGAYIIFLDLIKNAIHHTNEDGYVKIQFKQQENIILLHFINDGKLPEDVSDFINGIEIKTDINHRRKGGIRTIKRIIECPLFTSNNTSWKIESEKYFNSDKTDILLTIPIN